LVLSRLDDHILTLGNRGANVRALKQETTGTFLTQNIAAT
jgi:hypothetical protein